MSQDEAGPRHVTVEGSEGNRQQRNEQEKFGGGRGHGECQSEYGRDWTSVVA